MLAARTLGGGSGGDHMHGHAPRAPALAAPWARDRLDAGRAAGKGRRPVGRGQGARLSRRLAAPWWLGLCGLTVAQHNAGAALRRQVQIVSLAYYMFSYFPGGLAGLKLVSMSVGRAIKPAVSACAACLVGAEKGGGLLPL